MFRGGVVLLAAGRGSRLNELTTTTHKSLLPIGGTPALGRVLDQVLRATGEVVVVVGYKYQQVRAFVEERYPNRTVRFVINERWADDTNILSTQLGVEALSDAARGYLIVETDVVLADEAWGQVFAACASGRSMWFTKGRYAKELTGGCLSAATDGAVQELRYAPQFDERYAGWSKLLGLLYVGPDQTSVDRAIRAAEVERSTRQYYMQPWVDHLKDLPCYAADVGESFAMSFNDRAAYDVASDGIIAQSPEGF